MDTKRIIQQLRALRFDVGEIYKPDNKENGSLDDPWRILNDITAKIKIWTQRK